MKFICDHDIHIHSKLSGCSNDPLQTVERMLQYAKENNLNFLFEASVGGGIPVISPLISCVGQNKITEVRGILNGTTNYILTCMFKDGESFEDALKNGNFENIYTSVKK